MIWPFKSKPEARSAGDYTAQILQLAESAASGQNTNIGTTAGIEMVANLYENVLAGAMVETSNNEVKSLINPEFLALIGRSLVSSGECMFVIRMDRGGIQLLPSADFYFIKGGPDPRTWEITATCYGPSQTKTFTGLSWDSVLFFTWSRNAGTPYQGVSPARRASTTSTLHSNVEKHISNEASGPTGQVIPIDTDGNAEEISGIRSALGKLAGKVLLIESTNKGHMGDVMKGTKSDGWKANRLGASPPQSLVQLAHDSYLRTIQAAGVPASMGVDSEGASAREALRRFAVTSLRGLVKRLEFEIAYKLDDPGFKISIAKSAFYDQGTRANVLKRLTDAGVPVSQALVISELIDGE